MARDGGRKRRGKKMEAAAVGRKRARVRWGERHPVAGFIARAKG